MGIETMTFGIEIETTIPVGFIEVGPHGRGYAIPQLPGWKADRDPSIMRAPGREPCEFVSPVYTGTAGLKQLVADLATIRSLGASVNRSCGIHIHIGFDKSDEEASKKLASLVSNFEKAIFASTGTKNRERGRWCNGLQRHGTPDNAILNSRAHRYHVVNFATVKPTVEFRAFSASLNTAKIIGYVRMCAAMVEKALATRRAPKWVAKTPVETSPIHRSGEGQTALTRLFYALGWTKGRESHTFGNLTGDGLPEIGQSKKALMTMARKYDAQP